MTDEQWFELAATFVTGAAYIDVDKNGMPCNPDQMLECDILDGIAEQLRFHEPLPAGRHALAVHAAAVAWMRLWASRGRYSPDRGSDWLAARSRLPDVWDLTNA